MIITNFPHNPSGQMVLPSEWNQIIEIAKSADAILLSDESFRQLEIPPCETLPAACDLYERGISITGMSKPFGLGGLRIGWIATRSREILTAAKAYRYNTCEMTNEPCQWLAYHALKRADEILATNRNTIVSNLQRLEEFVAVHSKVLRLVRPKAGTMAMVEQRTSFTSTELCERLLNQQQLLLIPGEALNISDRMLRFGLGMTDFESGLRRLDIFLQSLKEPNASS